MTRKVSRMRKLAVLLFFFTLNSLLFADIPMEEFTVIDNCDGKILRLGNKLSKIYDMYPKITFKGEKKYSNMTYKEYQGDGIVFSISAYAKSEMDARVLSFEILSNRYSTRKGIVVGSTKEDVVSKYGGPEYIRGNSYYYFYSDYDVMELKFNFNEEGFVTSIVITVGT
jgi:hypothetical protein